MSSTDTLPLEIFPLLPTTVATNAQGDSALPVYVPVCLEGDEEYDYDTVEDEDDDQYEYETVGVPFLASLGREIYEYELEIAK